ncbi:leukocyte immunoglobulin-like receptor subfamily A member 6 isoform X1 [Eptesicus fuscus]|uniref:leukocyte immunoglobulin-like receptor subfamily A member 6 isoform X1 n=1 Tax=Eptesicus fuscus TaxID=29078 RepID=UPI002403F47D|nr:leukocyte immunoglobulin-like receptor subfamily A member 6 isoform X1 [Eptesicus fuscus]
MYPHPTTLLGLVLCLGQTIYTQEGALPKPSLRAEPGPVIPRGQPVTFVCRGPAGAELFRLEKEGSRVGPDQKSAPQDGSQGTEARFHIPAVSEDSAGRYQCFYAHVYDWSERSEPVQLQVTEEDVSTPPSGALPKPSLRAEPGPAIPRGRPVTFVCSSLVWTLQFRLEKDGSSVPLGIKPGSQDGTQGLEARFHIPAVSEDTAGRYRCLYAHVYGWSERSEPLQLQVTEEDVSTPPSGALPKPSLTAQPGPVIPRGQPVTFVCRGPAGAELFHLWKDGSAVPLGIKPGYPDGTQGLEASFVIPAVQEGSYRCSYYHVSRMSERSEPLQLQVTEEDVSAPPSGALPKPSLRAEPGPVIPRGQAVTFVCRGATGAEFFYLEKDRIPVPPEQISAPQDGSQGKEARFHIPAVSEDTAGRYQCVYQKGSGWSQLSEPLQLQVTEEDVSTPPSGALPKPSLRAQPGPVIPRGRPVTFVCQGPAGAEFFYLEKDGIPVPPDQISAPQDGSQGREGRFHIPAVSEDSAGRYQCVYEHVYGYSELSEPLQLQVTEEDVSTRPSGALPKPSLRAQPGPVIPRGRPVTFLCRGPAGAGFFHLEKDGRPVRLDQKSASQDGTQGTEARFHIPFVLEDTAGYYQCFYHQGSDWSERSEPVQLQVTEEDVSTRSSGALPKPSLRVELGPLLPWGRPVTLECRGPAGAEFFYLEKDGIPVLLDQISAPQNGSQGTEARFQIPAVSDNTAGRYQCFYAHVYGWSERSEPVQLQVTEEDVSAPPSGPASRDYTVENSIRLGLAGVALLILVAILVEAGLSQSQAPQGPQK